MRFLVVAFVAVMAGCTVDGGLLQGGEEIGFNVGLLSSSSSKGVMEIDGSLVEDVNVYVFNSEAEPLLHIYSSQTNIPVKDFLCFSKDRYSVYVLANWGSKLDVSSLEELKSVKYVPEDIGAVAEEAPVMTGYREGIHLYDGADIGVELSKIYACVILKSNMFNLNDGVSLTVERVTIKNVPQESLLFDDNVAESVVEGCKFEGESLYDMSGDGLRFYVLENMQGAVPGAQSNKDKAMGLEPHRRELCSYIEIECNLVSASHRGKMVYRFYLGSRHDNCNVLRNTSQNIEVKFVGNASEQENSVSVDNSALMDRVSRIVIKPSTIIFASIAGLRHQCEVNISPASAFDKRIVWSSTDKRVATVDANGVIVTVGSGRCTVYAKSVENPSVMDTMEVRVM